MKFDFRQGIQHSPLESVTLKPSFLTYNPGSNSVTISIGVDFVRATAVYTEFNYIIEERNTQILAWGPMDWKSVWGPEPGGNYLLYLYWDINRSTGLMSRSFTPYAPVNSLIEPTNPAVDQHWFDLTTNVMKVWDGTFWRKTIRVFAATFTKGTTTITEYDLGSQIDVTYGPEISTWPDHGFILFGADGRGIRYNDTNFVTTATELNTNHGSFSSPIRLELLNSTVLAAEPIPAFYAVSNIGDGTIQLADGSLFVKRPIGITMMAGMPGDPIDIVTRGIVYNDQWDWDVDNGEKDLYCGPTGEIVQGPVEFTNGAARLGTILSAQTVLIDVDLYAFGGADGPPGPTGPAGGGEGSEHVIGMWTLTGNSLGQLGTDPYNPDPSYSDWEIYTRVSHPDVAVNGDNQFEFSKIGVYRITVSMTATPDDGQWNSSEYTIYGTEVEFASEEFQKSTYVSPPATNYNSQTQRSWSDVFTLDTEEQNYTPYTTISVYSETSQGGIPVRWKGVVTIERMSPDDWPQN